MALVVVSGLACSGRTTRSREVLQDFGRRIATAALENAEDAGSKLRLVHLTDADANIDRDAYALQTSEKPARAAFLSLVVRNLARDAVVIADGGAGTNIKGFRYQLYCAAREVGVRNVSLLCVARPEICKERNRARKQKEAYSEDVLNELLMRFEEPNPMTRWDSPLFVIDCNANDSSSSLTNQDADTAKENSGQQHWEPAPLDAIWEAASSGRVTKAPDVVAPSRATASNYLSMLETTTQLVLSALQMLASTGLATSMGGEAQLPLMLSSSSSSTTTRIPIILPAGKGTPSTATLQRLRRQFLKMHASGAAAQNEIGLTMGSDGRGPKRSNATNGGVQTPSGGTSRAERKVEQFERQEKQQVDARRRAQAEQNEAQASRTPEEVIARRFVAYLEETL